jgi:hypothetical protein
MKKITINTKLKMGDKEFVGFQSFGDIFWRDESLNIVAQSNRVLNEIPLISLDPLISFDVINGIDKDSSWDIVSRMFPNLSRELFNRIWSDGFLSNPNIFSLNDIKRVVELSRVGFNRIGLGDDGCSDEIFDLDDILERISNVSVINIDENFNVISYE